MQQQHEQPFDLSSGPLLRVTLVRLCQNRHAFLLTVHHIVSDGWSLNILIAELGRLYRSFVRGESLALPELPIQYADFAYWQRQRLQGETLKRLLAYWRQQLRGYSLLSLPTDYPPPEKMSYRSGNYEFSLSADLTVRLKALSTQASVTLFMTLLAALQIALYRVTGQTDIAVGTDIAGRTHHEAEKLIGFFINLLVLRNDLSGSPSFHEVLDRTREMVLNAYTYQEAPFEMIVEQFFPDQQESRVPLVQVLFVLQNSILHDIKDIDGLAFRPVTQKGTAAKFDLALFMHEGPSGLRGAVKYSQDLFAAPTIANLFRRFEVLLHSCVTQPDDPIDILDMQTEIEKRSMEQQREKVIRTLKPAKGIERISLD